MELWQYMLAIGGGGVLLILVYAFVLLPLGDRAEDRRAEREARRDRGEIRGGE